MNGDGKYTGERRDMTPIHDIIGLPSGGGNDLPY